MRGPVATIAAVGALSTAGAAAAAAAATAATSSDCGREPFRLVRVASPADLGDRVGCRRRLGPAGFGFAPSSTTAAGSTEGASTVASGGTRFGGAESEGAPARDAETWPLKPSLAALGERDGCCVRLAGGGLGRAEAAGAEAEVAVEADGAGGRVGVGFAVGSWAVAAAGAPAILGKEPSRCRPPFRDRADRDGFRGAVSTAVDGSAGGGAARCSAPSRDPTPEASATLCSLGPSMASRNGAAVGLGFGCGWIVGFWLLVTGMRALNVMPGIPRPLLGERDTDALRSL